MVFNINQFLCVISELTQIVADVSQDPTLPRTKDHPCPKLAIAGGVFIV